MHGAFPALEELHAPYIPSLGPCNPEAFGRSIGVENASWSKWGVQKKVSKAHWFGTGVRGESGRLAGCEKRVQTRCYAWTPQLRPRRHPRRSARNFRPSGKFSKISLTDSSFPLQRRDLGVSLGSKHTHSAVGGGGGPRYNARAGLLAVRTVDSALTSSWNDGLWRGLPRKWRGHLVRLPRAFTALTLHHQVDRELAKYEARRLLYVNGLRSARR